MEISEFYTSAVSAESCGLPDHRILRDCKLLSGLRGILLCARFIAGMGGYIGHRTQARGIVCAVLFLSLLLSDLSGCRKVPKQPPHLILVTFDTTRADRISAYGYRRIRTPHIDEVAVEGTLFEMALSQVPLTAPSMASLMTSTYPFANGVRTTGFESLPAEARTLAEVMKGHGYQTAAIIGAFPLDRVFGLDQGFDYYDDRFTQSWTGSRGMQRKVIAPNLSTWAHARRFINRRMASDAERGAAEVTDAALEWLRQRPQGPFFLWVHYFDPHKPHQPPEKYMAEVRKNAAAYARERDKQVMTYDAEMLYMDREFGRLLGALRGMNLLEQSLLVLHADHGEEMWEHEYFGHGVNLFQTTMQVPLIFRGAGWPEGRRISQSVRLLDVAPTILETLGHPHESGFQGSSLLPLQNQGASMPVGPIYLETRFELQFPPEPEKGKGKQLNEGHWKRGLCLGQHKLIGTYTGRPYGVAEPSDRQADNIELPAGPVQVELYDLYRDPGEKENLAEKDPARVKKLEAELVQLIKSNQKALKDATSPALSAEEQEKLRSLGYVR